MVAKSKVWVKQITAAFFMLVLFAVTITQVLHTHSSGLTAVKSKANNQAKHVLVNEVNASTSNCFICDYQLTKDADTSYFLPQQLNNTAFCSFPCFSYSFTPTGIPRIFETRGPPYFI